MTQSPEITILPVAPIELINRWQEVEPLLDKAMPVNLRRYESIDILAVLIQGQAQAWFVRDGNDLLAVIITQVITFPRRRCFSLFCLSGRDMDRWLDAAQVVLADAARRTGCDHFEIIGRKGWERVFNEDPRGVIFVRDVAMNDGGAMN